MRVRVGGRMSGRTTEMIDYLLTHPEAVMVCMNAREEARVKRLILSRFSGDVLEYYKERISRMVVSSPEHLRGIERRPRTRNRLVCDNWDYFSRRNRKAFLWWPIEYVTVEGYPEGEVEIA